MAVGSRDSSGRPLRIALLQTAAAGPDLAANERAALMACRRAAAMDADLALLPEMFSAGYTLPDPRDDEAVRAWRKLAIDRDHGYLDALRDLARELELAIGITYLERTEQGPRNSLALVDRHGRDVLHYAKVHTCAFDRESVLTPGGGFSTTRLDTEAGELCVGAMICYDREFPESARILALAGAELILTPNACNLEPHRLNQFASRAFENMVAVAMTNYPAPQCNGHSVAFDGQAFDSAGRHRDMKLVEAGEAPGIYLASLDLTALRAYRAREPWGAAWRRPATYGPLTATQPDLVADGST